MRLTKILVILAAFMCCNQSMAQTATSTIKGKVINESTDKSLHLATVTLVGAKKTTVTDEQGNFTIKLPDDKKQYKLSVGFTGFITKEITVKAGDNVTVKLKEDVKDEGEVVIQTGYGNAIKKKELAASVSTVGAKDLKDIPINSVGEALNGRLAGVTATTAEGSPDAEIRVRVRGGGSITQDNSPLYVIDGVIVENGLSNIVLQDIQDISVLKDAAATAIYGARGANGVIVITTKSGKTGKLRVSYNAYYGYKSLPKTLDVMKPNDFVLYLYERSRGSSTDMANFATDYASTWDSVVNFQEYKKATPVNWQKEVLGNTGFTQQHNISLGGGTKKFNYTGGYTYQDDKAIVLNSTYKRHQINTKFEYKINSKLKVTVSGRYTNQNVFGAGVSDDKGTAYNRLRQTVKYRPYILTGESLDQVDPDEDLPVGNGLSLINPIKLANQEFKKKTTNAYNITASLTYNINKHFTFKSTFGLDNSLTETRTFNDSITGFSVIQNARNPIISFDSTQKKAWVNSNTISYNLKNYKNKHDIDILLGQEARSKDGMIVSHQSRDIKRFANRDSLFDVFNTLTEYVGFGQPTKARTTGVSFFTRIGYTFNKKYIFSFVARADASSKFIGDNTWGYFTAASAAWRLSQEKFFNKVKFFDDVKLRVGYGGNGNDNVGDYLYSSVFNPSSYYYGLNSTAVYAWSSAQLANQKVKWESLINRNIGIDLVFLKKKIELSVDYYHNTSKDLLLNAQIAPTFGYSQQIQNIGKTKNTGVEVQLNANILQSKKGLNWNANFNMSFNKNEIVELNNGLQSFFAEPTWGVSGQPADYIVKVGESVGSVWGFVTDGFYKVEDFNYNGTTQTYTLKPGVVVNNAAGPAQPGSIKFKDLNGDGIVGNTDADKKIIGNTNAKFTGGLNQQFSYKNLDASIFLNFSYGNDIYNANKIEFTNGYTPNSNLIASSSNRWKTVNDLGTVVTDPTELAALNERATIWKPITGAGAFYPHSWAIEDGSFVRINNITIGYSLPVKTLVKWGISRFRIYVTGNNLAVFTNYSGFDPEVSVKRSGLTPGLDYSAYPKSRSVIFGLNVNF